MKVRGRPFLWLAFGVLISAPSWSQRYQHTFAWSPDSRKILYTEEIQRGNELTTTLYSIKADGTSPVKVADDAWSPAWSRDGNTIAYSKKVNGSNTLFLANEDGTGAMRLFKESMEGFEADFSIDGYLLFTGKQNQQTGVYRIRLDGTGLTQIVAPPGTYTPGWSPSGKQIIFYRDKGDRMDKIILWDISSKRERVLTQDTLHNFYPSWTREGQIVFTSTTRLDKQNEKTQAIQISADGKQRKVLNIERPWFLRVSPDGKKFAYIRNNPGLEGSKMFVCDRDGSHEVCIVP